jgi:hypothetical protein
MKSNNGSNNNPSFCLEVWGTDYNKIKDTCILAEKLEYDGFYYGESLADLIYFSNMALLESLIKPFACAMSRPRSFRSMTCLLISSSNSHLFQVYF